MLNYTVRTIDRFLRFDTVKDSITVTLLPFAATPNAQFEMHRIDKPGTNTNTVKIQVDQTMGSTDVLLPDGTKHITLTDTVPWAVIKVPETPGTALVISAGGGGGTGGGGNPGNIPVYASDGTLIGSVMYQDADGEIGVGTIFDSANPPQNQLDVGFRQGTQPDGSDNLGGIHIYPGGHFDTGGNWVAVAGDDPGNIRDTLYNDSGTLMWNGSAVGSGTGPGTKDYFAVFKTSTSIQDSSIYQANTLDAGQNLIDYAVYCSSNASSGVSFEVDSTAPGAQAAFGLRLAPAPGLGWNPRAYNLYIDPNTNSLRIYDGMAIDATHGADRLTLDTAGRFGIGVETPTPFAQLDIAANSSAQIAGIHIASGDPGAVPIATCDILYQFNHVLYWNGVPLGGNVTSTGSANYFPVFTSASNIGNSLMMQSGNYVGLGTGNPQCLFHVASNDSAGTQLRIQNTSTGQPSLGLVAGNRTWAVGVHGESTGNFNVFDGSVAPAGAERFTIDTSGRVGIGVSQPTAGSMLDIGVNSAAQIAGIHIASGDPSGPLPWDILYQFNHTLYWNGAPLGGNVTSTGTTNWIPVFTSASNIGNSWLVQIGNYMGLNTANPQCLFHMASNDPVSTQLRIQNTSTGRSTISMIAGTANQWEYDIFVDTADNWNLFDVTHSAYRIQILPSGFVGIGLNLPSAMVHVYNNDPSSTQLLIQNGSTGQPSIALKIPTRVWTISINNPDHGLHIYDGTAAADRIAIIPGANASVGSPASSATIDINGVLAVEQKNFGGYAGVLVKGGASGGYWGTIGWSGQNSAGTDIEMAMIACQPTTYTAAAEAGDMVFYTMTGGCTVSGGACNPGGLERFRISHTGAISIATGNPAAYSMLDIGVNTAAQMAGIHIVSGNPGAVPIGTSDILYQFNHALFWNGQQLGSVTFTGTANYIPVFTSASNIGNSWMMQVGNYIGLNTANPQTLFHIASNDSGSTQLRVQNTSTGQPSVGLVASNRIWTMSVHGESTGNFNVFDGSANAERLTIDTNGNLGVGGATAPNAQISTGVGLAPIKVASWDGGPSVCYGIGVANSTLTFGASISATSGVPQMVLTSGGRVGIGTGNAAQSNAPQAKLHVADADGASTQALVENTSTGQPSLGLKTPSRVWTISVNSGSLAFYDGTANANRVWINTAGQVGIGMTAISAPPAQVTAPLLDVNGPVFIEQKTFGNYAGLLLKGGATGGNWGTIGWSTQNTNGADVMINMIACQPTNSNAGSESGDMLFYTRLNAAGNAGGSERMRIKDSGFIGINTASPDCLLNVNSGRLRIIQAAEPYGLGLNYPGYIGIWLGGTSDSALAFSNWGGGELMRLTQAGKVGIGTASIDANALLHLYAAGSYTQLLLQNVTAGGQPTIGFKDSSGYLWSMSSNNADWHLYDGSWGHGIRINVYHNDSVELPGFWGGSSTNSAGMSLRVTGGWGGGIAFRDTGYSNIDVCLTAGNGSLNLTRNTAAGGAINTWAQLNVGAFNANGTCNCTQGYYINGTLTIDTSGNFFGYGVHANGGVATSNITASGYLSLGGQFRPAVVYGQTYTAGLYDKWIEVHDSNGNLVGLIPIF